MSYGDDATMATNYPIVAIRNNATGHVVYCRTFNHSTLGINTGTVIHHTQFTVPTATETGASTITAIANGIPSNPVAVNVVLVKLKEVKEIKIEKLEKIEQKEIKELEVGGASPAGQDDGGNLAAIVRMLAERTDEAEVAKEQSRAFITPEERPKPVKLQFVRTNCRRRRKRRARTTRCWSSSQVVRRSGEKHRRALGNQWRGAAFRRGLVQPGVGGLCAALARRSAVIGGNVVTPGDISGILTLRPAVFAPELRGIHVDDRPYVAAELNAFLTQWLMAQSRRPDSQWAEHDLSGGSRLATRTVDPRRGAIGDSRAHVAYTRSAADPGGATRNRRWTCCRWARNALGQRTVS